MKHSMLKPSAAALIAALIGAGSLSAQDPFYVGVAFNTPSSNTYLTQINLGILDLMRGSGDDYNFHLYGVSGYYPTGSPLYSETRQPGHTDGWLFYANVLLAPNTRYVFLGGVTDNYQKAMYEGGSQYLMKCNVSLSDCQPEGVDISIEGFSTTFTAPPTTVPEPVSLVLLGTGLIGVAAARRRKRRS